MKKSIAFVFVLILSGFYLSAQNRGQERVFRVTIMYEADDQGKVIRQQPYSGQVILRGDGTYHLTLHITDEGRYQFVKGNSSQPHDTIYFHSNKNSRYFAYLKPQLLAVWLYKTPQGINVWANAVPANSKTQTPAAQTPTSRPDLLPGTKALPPGLIRDGKFTAVAMYGDTNSPSYHWYDEQTGSISTDEKGLLLRPDGTYFLRFESGSQVLRESGKYAISGDNIRIVFSDGSYQDFKMVNGGQTLHMYSAGGFLVRELFFLGTVR